MQDGAVTFVQGDAFSFEPPTPVDWLVSDVIAYPERVSELLERWCTQRWATQAVVTMKFQGDPDWGALQRAVGVAEKAGYAVRVKHFFSNKNEVTLMMRALDGETRRESER
ncbi:sam-dependent methyltransferase [Chrysochromulina tobinii]|jgi:23S rRNA (cytidine2498-2'-O)-methyltransferase|uniref:Sam-dependent methyltransferase n=1 Tax=Chrysochromulina tobinii TaxID=1460289 RepID=A0A0M0J4X8_9EUKA|nr:sam-dependent methyltransferase [Chrysochromulina tobinii]|eukprot:KOO21377.1 sam-dependent methyltransferase [Chrysochromulina sp. CCMP291]